MADDLLKDWKDHGNLIGKEFFERNTEEVAKDLLGKILIKRENEGYIAVRIVETEAYFGKEDPASHAFKGPTKRSKIMYDDAGILYVYLCYGFHHLLNIVTETKGKPGAVLIRAAEPLYGIKLMQGRRKTKRIKNLLSGPAKLTKALAIDLSFNGKRISTETGIFLLDDEYFVDKIVRKSRIGVPRIENDLYRFYIAGSKFVSKE